MGWLIEWVVATLLARFTSSVDSWPLAIMFGLGLTVWLTAGTLLLIGLSRHLSWRVASDPCRN